MLFSKFCVQLHVEPVAVVELSIRIVHGEMLFSKCGVQFHVVPTLTRVVVGELQLNLR